MDIIKSLDLLTTSGVIILILTFIQITPIKFNPWSFLLKIFKFILKSFGTLLNGDISEKMDCMGKDINQLQKKVTEMDNKMEDVDSAKLDVSLFNEQITNLNNNINDVNDSLNESKIITSRQRLLRFADEIMIGTPHSKGSFDQILDDIDKYNKYCEIHKDFKNHITIDSAKLIEKKYMEHLENNDFLK